jgi:UDP-N-acetylglucosamine--dolichyl-phosphate N-acetylglucosaminephosphotransferase
MSFSDITVVYALIVAAISFIVTYFLTLRLIKYLTRRGMVVKDYHKPEETMVPRPGGHSIIAGIVAGELALFIFTLSNGVLAILLCTVIAYFAGYIDDKRVMSGYFKPLALLVAAVPIILLGTYDSDLEFPLFGSAKIPLLYIAVILITITVMANTANSIDVLNGVLSGFMAISSIPLIIALVLQNKVEIAIAALPLLFSALAFYKYHRYPSKIFPGDSGALLWGAMYGAIAIVGSVEVVATVALLPAIINSFLFLASVKKIVEHRQLKGPTILLDDYRIMASRERGVRVSLVRLIVAHGPMSEKDIARSIFKLAGFSAGLSILTALMMAVRI